MKIVDQWYSSKINILKQGASLIRNVAYQNTQQILVDRIKQILKNLFTNSSYIKQWKKIDIELMIRMKALLNWYKFRHIRQIVKETCDQIILFNGNNNNNNLTINEYINDFPLMGLYSIYMALNTINSCKDKIVIFVNFENVFKSFMVLSKQLTQNKLKDDKVCALFKQNVLAMVKQSYYNAQQNGNTHSNSNNSQPKFVDYIPKFSDSIQKFAKDEKFINDFFAALRRVDSLKLAGILYRWNMEQIVDNFDEDEEHKIKYSVEIYRYLGFSFSKPNGWPKCV